VRAVGLHSDVVVVTSRVWQTTCTLVRSGEEAFCVDSPVLPDELELLPAVAQQSRFTVVGLLATHADWDHLLAGYGFPEASLGTAGSTAEALQRRPGDAQREMRRFDDDHYVERPGPLVLPAAQALPVPGRCGLGDAELELHPAEGHTGDGMAIWIPWASVLACGDYLSSVGIPVLNRGGSIEAYLDTLTRLEPLVQSADWVVPGHGEPLDGQRALAILREDRAYLEALREGGADAALPLARRTATQRRIHADNVTRANTAV
jgi:glyoxylase-like metal-dependent hydrolase (beta-lactamase superfamily II)